ncbi:GLPGLI family protein [Chryseobacterium sp.]|uniref:GLPGLI family protein n=1 Tax=Chryseobacterium sp. TaxID=1871047 RepID=UPI00321BFD21
MKILTFGYCFLFLIMVSNYVNAQNSSFIYELNYKTHSDSLKSEKIIFYLDVKNKESVFRSEKFRESDSLRGKRGWGNGFDMGYNNNQLYVSKKKENSEILKYVFVPLIYNIYAIPIHEKFSWKMADERKKIGNYNCQKANAEYGGRTWTAWFTNEIPLQQGPYVFYGLPGLIVKISDEKLDYDFELIQVKDFTWKELYTDKVQKQIKWEDFKKLQQNYYSDPIAMINKSDVTSYDEGGNKIKTNFKEMKESIQKKILEKNNPIELDHKVEFK